MKKIGIMGAGYVGLSSGIELSKRGYEVTIFEKEDVPGGLASGFCVSDWAWSLEKHYHHWFSSDSVVKSTAKEVNHEIMFTRPKTFAWYENEFHQLDSPQTLLSFPHISFLDRLRTGCTLFYMKTIADWKKLENVTTKDFLIKTMGEKSWNVIWKPLMVGKFGALANNIPASWFWARIKARTPTLGYPIGGFESFSLSMVEKFQSFGGSILYNTSVTKITKKNDKVLLQVDKKDKFEFDSVICTLPTPFLTKLTKGFPQDYKNELKFLKGLGAITMVLSLKKPFLKNKIYWLNINEMDYPFLAVVEHTNFIDKKHYNNEYIVYIGNYLPSDHKYFGKDKEKLLDIYLPYLKKINKSFDKSWIKRNFVFKEKFAQPVVTLNFSKNIPDIRTPVRGLYLANMQQVYPWDRGTNFALKLGLDVANIIKKDYEK